MINIYAPGWNANAIGTDMPDAQQAYDALGDAGYAVALHPWECENANVGVDWCTDYECAAVDAVCERRQIPE